MPIDQQRLFNVVIIPRFVLLFSGWLLALGCSSGDSSAPGGAQLTIADTYHGLLDAETEEVLAQAVEGYAWSQYKATALINSTLFADYRRTSMDVVAARANAAVAAIDEALQWSLYLVELEETFVMPLLPSGSGGGDASSDASWPEHPLAKKHAGDQTHAWRLIDLYMNDDAFYRKYKLSDIARRTGVSMARLRYMMQQTANEAVAAGYDEEAEVYQQAVVNMKTIRDTAVAAEGALVTFASGGAAAGTIGTFAKGVAVVEKVNAVVSCVEAASTVITTSLGTDETPAAIQTIFKANKVVSYVLLPKALAAGDPGSIIALTGPASDITDTYFNINPGTNTATVSTTPNDPTQVIHPADAVVQVADDFLLPGDYQLPLAPLTGPTPVNSGFSFVEDPTTNDDLVLDTVNMADLWDLDSAVTDTMTWDTERRNPSYAFAHISSRGFDPSRNPLAFDPAISSPALADTPAVTITADVWVGEAPLAVNFGLIFESAAPVGAVYSWRFGDGGLIESALDSPVHTYLEAGTFFVTVYVRPSGGAALSASAVVTVRPGTATVDGDRDSDTDADWPVDVSFDCFTPGGFYCFNGALRVDGGVVICNRTYRSEMTCTGKDTWSHVRFCDDGDPLTWDQCGAQDNDTCGGRCDTVDHSSHERVTVDYCSRYANGRQQWCSDFINQDDQGNVIGPYFTYGIYRCADATTLQLVEACPCSVETNQCQGFSRYPGTK